MVGKRPHTSFHTHPSATTFSSRFLFWKNESKAFPPWEGLWAPPTTQKRGASIPTRREGWVYGCNTEPARKPPY